jgi:hypothetical protein
VALFVPLSDEGWLNTINSYTFLATVVFLILLEDVPENLIRRWAYRVLLLISGLSGTLACFLIPFFFYQAWREKHRERLIQALVLTVCATLQISLIFTFRSYGSIEQRFTPIGLTTLGATLWTQSLGLFTAGLGQAQQWSRTFVVLYTDAPQTFQWWGRSLLVAAVVLSCCISANLPARQRVIFLGSYWTLLVLSLVFSIIPDKYSFINNAVHHRVFLASNTILGWMLLAGIQFPTASGWRSWLSRAAGLLCAAMLCAALISGMRTYQKVWVPSSAWPDWRQETQTWQADPAYLMRIQPEGWFVNLNQP